MQNRNVRAVIHFPLRRTVQSAGKSITALCPLGQPFFICFVAIQKISERQSDFYKSGRLLLWRTGEDG